MKKIYVLGPLAGLIVFSGFYWKYFEAHQAQLEASKRHDELVLQEKKRQQAADQAKAAEQARLAMAKRDQERAEKQKIDDAQKQVRTDLDERRTTATTRILRLRPQIDHARVELDATTAAVTRNEERIRELHVEQDFLRRYVKQAETDRDTFFQLLEKLETAERTRAAATPPSNRGTAERGS